jgi:hypothetical protein
MTSSGLSDTKFQNETVALVGAKTSNYTAKLRLHNQSFLKHRTPRSGAGGVPGRRYHGMDRLVFIIKKSSGGGDHNIPLVT